MGGERFSTIDSSISPLEATAVTVGTVIGLGIWVLPAQLVGLAGPAFLLSIVLGMVPLAFALLQMVQLGSAIPVAGGTYVYGSRLIHPYFGFLAPWIGVPAVWAGLLFTGTGFAEYVGFYTDVPKLAIVYAVLVGFLVINLLGIRIVARLQLVMVAIILAGAVAFVGPGISAIEPANYTPVFPNGLAPVAVATVSIYPTLQGFAVVLELGEELEQPERAVPRVLGASAVVGLTVTIALVAVLIGLRHWSDLVGLEAGFAVVGESFLPWWGGSLLVAAAVMSGLTTINTNYTAFSRGLMRAARDGAVPTTLAELHDRWETPHKSIGVIGVPPLLLAPLGPNLVVLSILISMALLIGLFNGSFALWNLPKRYPDRYEAASLTLPRRLVKAVAVGSAVSSGLLFVALSAERPVLLGGFLGWLALGLVAYKLRVVQVARRGRDLHAAMTELHENE